MHYCTNGRQTNALIKNHTGIQHNFFLFTTEMSVTFSCLEVLNLSNPSLRSPWKPKISCHLTLDLNTVSFMCRMSHRVSERSCCLMRSIQSASSGARYASRYSSRSLLKLVGDSPAVPGLPSGNLGYSGLIHILWHTSSMLTNEDKSTIDLFRFAKLRFRKHKLNFNLLWMSSLCRHSNRQMCH